MGHPSVHTEKWWSSK